MKRLLILCAAVMSAAILMTTLEAAEPVALKTTELGRGPTVVFVHTLGSARMVWMPTARKLIGDHRVVMVDLPGHGESATPDPFSLEACSEALSQVLAKHKPESTVVVAHGLGAMLALQAAHAHPGNARGLVVIDAATRMANRIPDQQQKYFLRALDSNYDNMMKMMFAREARDTVEAMEMVALAQKVPPAVMKSYLGAAMNADVSAALKDLKPALLFVGTDRNWPADKDWPTLAKDLGYESAPAVESRRVTGAGSLVMKEQPDSLAAIVRAFTAKAIAKK